MSKVMIDTDKISNNLMPMVSNARSSISTARSCASRAYFPREDYGWNRVCSNLSDCVERVGKYYNWANGLNQKFVRCLQQNLENISSIQVEAIKKSSLSVK